MEARDILIRPLITERTTQLMAEGKYVFVVAKAANKIEIAKAVAEIFNVNGARVATLQKGINIVRMSNGTIQKILVK